MTTKIKLEYPYNEKWKWGYLNINSEGRKTLVLYNSHSDRSSTQYARYLYAVNQKRFLLPDEHIDHIDNDKSNNSIENLQILTLAENNQKSNTLPPHVLTCPKCGKVFELSRSKASGVKARERVLANKRACSRKCASKKRIKHNCK